MPLFEIDQLPLWGMESDVFNAHSQSGEGAAIAPTVIKRPETSALLSFIVAVEAWKLGIEEWRRLESCGL